MRQQLSRKLIAFLVLYTFLVPTLVLKTSAAPMGKSLTEEQKILHVLNRLGFGARPGDVEKVKKVGLDKYIQQQLDPASIDDSAAEAKVKGLEVFQMSTAEVFAKYPNPGALLRQLEGGKKAQANNKAQPQEPEQMTEDQQRERRPTKCAPERIEWCGVIAKAAAAAP